MSRIEQVNSVLQAEISKIIEEYEISRDGLVTITAVEADEDLKTAVVWVAVLGVSAEERVCELQEKEQQIRQKLRRRIKMKYVPHLNFRLDKSGESAARVERLLRQIEEERKNS
jgi:ribosome-binding factor A